MLSKTTRTSRPPSPPESIGSGDDGLGLFDAWRDAACDPLTEAVDAADGDIEGLGDPVEDAEPVGTGLWDAEGVVDCVGVCDNRGLVLGVCEGDGEPVCVGDCDSLGEPVADSDAEGDCDAVDVRVSPPVRVCVGEPEPERVSD